MIDSFLTHGDTGLVVLRLAVGFIFLYHGLMKWKMPPMKGMMNHMMMVLKIVEPIVGVFLILGLYGGEMAFIVAILMLGAIGMKLSMMKTPFSSMKATGWEFDLILLASAIVLLTSGVGTPWI